VPASTNTRKNNCGVGGQPIEVWWGNGRDTITSLRPYNGPLSHLCGPIWGWRPAGRLRDQQSRHDHRSRRCSSTSFTARAEVWEFIGRLRGSSRPALKHHSINMKTFSFFWTDKPWLGDYQGRAYRLLYEPRRRGPATVIAVVNQGIDSRLEACFVPAGATPSGFQTPAEYEEISPAPA